MRIHFFFTLLKNHGWVSGKYFFPNDTDTLFQINDINILDIILVYNPLCSLPIVCFIHQANPFRS
jgi:hypothetical protein